MKRFKTILTLVACIFTQIVFGQGEDVKIEVIDFHSTHRCKTCNAIEANAEYTHMRLILQMN